MKKIDIPGIPVFTSCNNLNDILRDRYFQLELEETRLREEIKEREKRIAEIREEYKDLNKAEVGVVLDYVRSYTRTNCLMKQDMDMLLCHCQNKLNGNINSTFLHFVDPKDEEDKADESTDN